MDNEARTIVVIGTGSIGMRHLQVLRQMANVLPIAIPKRRERIGFLEDAGFATALDLQVAVGMGATLCIIATDTNQHAQDGLLAVEGGLDVLVEKPLSTDAQQARRLCQKAKETGHRVFVGCVLRFSESLNRFRDMLHTIGQLHSVRIESQSYLPNWRPDRPYRDSYSARAEEGGVLRDLIHEIDYAGWILGWPKSLQARVRNLGRLGIEAEEAAELIWETTDGCTVSMSLDYLTRPPRRHMRAAGELGMLEWDCIEGTTTLALAAAPVQVIRSPQTWDEVFLAQARAFIDACQGSCDQRLATGEEGIKALAICDAARRAGQSRREQPVE